MTLASTKRLAYELLLSSGSVFIHLDPRREGVAVPPWLRHQAQLVLQVGNDMNIPIPDLTRDDRGVSGTLSFARTPFKCEIPWSAVFALVGDDGKGAVYSDDMPAEIVAEVEAEEARKRRGPGVVTTKSNARIITKRGKVLPLGWRVIDGGGGGLDNAS